MSLQKTTEEETVSHLDLRIKNIFQINHTETILNFFQNQIPFLFHNTFYYYKK